MTPYDIISIGHISNDILDDRGTLSRFTGGGAWFSAFAAARTGARLLVVTRLAERDSGLLEPLKDEGVELVVLPGHDTTSIENVFESEDVDRRRVTLLSQADPFSLEDIPAEQTKIYNLAGLFRGEIPPELIVPLAARAKVALDLQAVLRTSEEGKFAWKDWQEKADYLPCIHYLKADSLESEVVTGLADREAASRRLIALGAREVMITHSSEVLVSDGVTVARAPFNPRNLSGRTGRGDSCFGAYLARRLKYGLAESVRYAAALTSIKMESPGPFLGSPRAVQERMAGLEVLETPA
jgi:sugar/nucleoside kinase (ribokinase family)